MNLKPFTLAAAGELLKSKKPGSRFTVNTLAERMTLLQAASATGRVIKTKANNGKFRVWVIE
jgi:hypothetical protein